MLLIDPHQSIASWPADAAPVPYFFRDFGGDALRIANFLTRAMSLERLIPLLLTEFAFSGYPPKLAAALPVLIVAEAARAIADGSIKVGQAVPDAAVLV